MSSLVHNINVALMQYKRK